MKRTFGYLVFAFVVSASLSASAFAQDGQGQGQGQGQQGQGQGQQGQGQQGQGQGQQGQRQRRGGQRQSVADQLKPLLTLTDDQVTKVKALEETERADSQKLRQDMQGGDRTAMREKSQAITDKFNADIRGLLEKEQVAKFDDWVKQQDARRQQRQNGQNGRGQNGQQQGQGRGNRSARLLDQVEKELTLTPDEKGAVLPLVKKILDTRDENRASIDKRRQELAAFSKGKTGSPEDKAVISAKLKEYRDANKADEEKLKAAQEAVREVLTVENEAKLCGLGILP